MYKFIYYYFLKFNHLGQCGRRSENDTRLILKTILTDCTL